MASTDIMMRTLCACETFNTSVSERSCKHFQFYNCNQKPWITSPFPKEPLLATHIRVPYKCTEPYDGEDFFSYPDRKGWTKEHLLGEGSFGGRSDAEIQAFFQGWLYFGTLICVFKLQEIEIDPSEFITTDEKTEEIFVTTGGGVLTSKVQEWRKKWKGNVTHRESKEADTTKKIITEVSSYTDRYCGIEGRESVGVMRAPTATDFTWPVSGEISMSIIALGFILGEALKEIHDDGRTNLSFGGNPFLKGMMLENGWCPSDVRRLIAEIPIGGQYYLALKEYPHGKDRHRGCHEFGCIASTIKEGNYVTKHTQEGCECMGDMATKEVVQVIEDGGVPVVSWKKIPGGDGGSGFTVENASATNIPYVAISHVWADGLGNPHENAIPICELELIQSRVDAISPDSERQPAPFWMDTLCIPVAEEHKPLRKRSIKMMRQIYRRAEAILVFDAGLQQLPLSSTIGDKSLAIFTSNWIHRLWTLQEAMFAKQLYFWLKDGPLDNEDFHQDILKLNEADVQKGLHGSFQWAAHSAALGSLSILRDFVEMKLGGPGELFTPLTHDMHQRTTTRISDEAICAATILDMDTEDILAVETKHVSDEVLAAKRMEIFLKQVGEFRPGIIFHHHKRLRTEGYRWAPKTIMGSEPRYFLRNAESSDNNLTSFKGRGLRVRSPGFILETVAPGSRAKITVKMKNSEHRYSLQLFPEDVEGDGTSCLWEPNAVYAVVLFRTVSARLSTGTDAIVGILMDPAEVHDVQGKRRHKGALNLTIKLKCECRAWMEPLDLGLSTDESVVELLEKEQKWRVY